MIYTNVLLGATKDNELVFARFGITNRNGYDEFTASFYTVRPFNGENADLVEYWDNYITECDADTLRHMLGMYDCTISNLAECLADDMEIEGTFDCSMYPEVYTIDGDDWYFESMSCGQCDTRGDMVEYTNKRAYKELNELWDKYHMKEVGEYVIDKVEQIANELNKMSAEKWIVDYIHRHIDELY